MKIIQILILAVIGMASNAIVVNQCKNSVNIIKRRNWGAKPAKDVTYQTLPIKYVIIGETQSSKCSTKSRCAEIVGNIQAYHMDELGLNDITYNFLVGNDGNVYEGVGWHKVGRHTTGYNHKSIGISFIGGFAEELPSEEALTAAKNLIECGVELGNIHRRYKLMGKRQLNASDSPGLELYNEIQEWDNWIDSPHK